MPLDLNLLKVFVAVMRTRSVSRAADVLDMTPPAVSQALNRLRNHYLDRLFLFQGKQMVPTSFASSLYNNIDGAFNQITANIDRCQPFDAATSSRCFRISCPSDIANLIVRPIQEYLDRYAPGITVIFNMDGSTDEERYQSLKLQQVDLAITSMPMTGRGYESQIVLEETLAIAVRAEHPRIATELQASHFFNEKHVVVYNNMFDQISALLGQEHYSGRQPAIVFREKSVSSGLVLCAETDWLCLAPRHRIEQLMSLSLPIRAMSVPRYMEPLRRYLAWLDDATDDFGCAWLKALLIQLFTYLGCQQGTLPCRHSTHQLRPVAELEAKVC